MGLNHIKLFEEMNIKREEFHSHGHAHNLSPRERKILSDLVSDGYYQRHLNEFIIRVEDQYYYTRINLLHTIYYNRFDDFNELKDYVLSWYYMYQDNTEEYLKLLKTTKLDPSFDNNYSIYWASIGGNKEIVKLLLKDERVRSKLTEEEIYKMNYRKTYGNKISH